MNNFCIGALVFSIAQLSRAASIFPTTPGASWEYEVTDFPPGRAYLGPINVLIAGREQIDGKDVIRLETCANNVLQKTELITADEHGVSCLRRSIAQGKTVSFESPQPLIPPELKVGAKWTLDDEVAGAGIHQQFTVAAEEDVAVPAGIFHAFRFECEEPWPISIAVQRWFAPGTGFVKDITTTRGPTGRLLSRVTIVLKKFAPTAAPLPNEISTPSSLRSAATLPPTMTLEVAKARDGERFTEFRTDAPNIFVRWTGDHLPVGGTVHLVWIAEDVGDVAPANFIVDRLATIVDLPESGAQFTLSRPKDGWAAGKYRVELYLDDKLMESAKVTIAD